MQHLESYVIKFVTRSNLLGDDTMNFMGHIVRNLLGEYLSYKEFFVRAQDNAQLD